MSENVAVVLTALGLPNVTVPGPLPLVQATVKDPGGLGSPSSVTVAMRVAAEETGMVWSAPAYTFGATFWTGSTVICTWSLTANAPSFAVSRSTYVPVAENVARVSA